MSAEDSVDDGVRVVRLVNPGSDYIGDDDLPTWKAFAPSDQDKRQQPVRVSAWDCAVVDAARARLIASRAADHPAFLLPVSAIREEGRRAGRPGVDVVRDPEGTPPELPPHERNAHLGIEGLERRPGEPRDAWRSFLVRLGKLATQAP